MFSLLKSVTGGTKQSLKLSMKEKDFRLVHGWIRAKSKDVNVNIPFEVIELFVIWYHIQLYFIKISNGQVLNDDKTIINQTGSCVAASAWGSVLMSSMDEKVYEYTIKLLPGSESRVAIGIDEDGYKRLNSWFVQQNESIHYAFECWNGCKDSKEEHSASYGEEVEVRSEGSIIRMKYDVGKRTLSFIVDGKDYGVAFNNVQKGENIKYRLAVYLYGYESVELLGIK